VHDTYCVGPRPGHKVQLVVDSAEVLQLGVSGARGGGGRQGVGVSEARLGIRTRVQLRDSSQKARLPFLPSPSSFGVVTAPGNYMSKDSGKGRVRGAVGRGSSRSVGDGGVGGTRGRINCRLTMPRMAVALDNAFVLRPLWVLGARDTRGGASLPALTIDIRG
jgi:hypothetical protein